MYKRHLEGYYNITHRIKHIDFSNNVGDWGVKYFLLQHWKKIT